MIIFHSVEGKEDKTPLYYAAMAGKHEIVAYLLSITGVSPDNKTVCSYLLFDHKHLIPLPISKIAPIEKK